MAASKERLLLGQDGGRPRSVEVHNLPFAIAAVPHSGLLRLGRAWDATRIQVLRDADVGDAGRLVAHQMDVGVQDGGVHGLAVPGPHWRWGWEGAEEMHLGAFFTSFTSPSPSDPLGRGTRHPTASFPQEGCLGQGSARSQGRTSR